MVTVIKKSEAKKTGGKQLDKALKSEGVNTHKHCGVIKLGQDPLAIQRQLRDEWE